MVSNRHATYLRIGVVWVAFSACDPGSPDIAPLGPDGTPIGDGKSLVSVDWQGMSMSDVRALGMFFHESGNDPFDPSPSHGHGPSLALVSDATFGTVLRMKQDPTPGWLTVKGRKTIPDTDIVWFRARVRWDVGYFEPRVPNHKLLFFDWVSTGGSQRVERSSGSFAVSGSQAGVSWGDDVPIRAVGNFSFAPGMELGEVFTDGEWYEFVMYFGKISPGRVKTGWWIRRLTRDGVVDPGPWQIRTVDHPASGNARPVASFSLGENINDAPPRVLYLYYGPFDVFDGAREPDPFGLAGDLQ